MSSYVVWIDTSHAKLFNLTPQGIKTEEVKNHPHEHHHAEVAKKVLSVENMDHPTDAQIVAHAKKFFKHAHLFT